MRILLFLCAVTAIAFSAKAKLSKEALKNINHKQRQLSGLDIVNALYHKPPQMAQKKAKTGLEVVNELYHQMPQAAPRLACGESKYGCNAGARLEESKIVGGVNAQENEFPWQVTLQYDGSSLTCGGSLIDNTHILTAAHCVQGSMATASRWTAVIGNHRLSNSDSHQQSVSISSVVSHPDYGRFTNDYDVAIMTLRSAVSLNENVNVVCLAASSSGDFSGQTSHITGWGTTSSGGFLSNTLQKVAVPIITNTQCSNWYGSGYRITDRMICAGLEQGGKDSCQGDSGGPMMVKGTGSGCPFTQVGIVSWGVGCAGAKKPGVYTRVSEVRSWIDSQM